VNDARQSGVGSHREYAVFQRAGLIDGACNHPVAEGLFHRQAFASNPLSRTLYCGRRDEFGQIELALRMLEADAGALVGHISDAAQRLGRHTAELAEQLQDSQLINQQQQSETERVAAAVNQMVASVQEVASNAKNSATAANLAGAQPVRVSNGLAIPAAQSANWPVRWNRPLRRSSSWSITATRFPWYWR
jgi:hypothetical protein